MDAEEPKDIFAGLDVSAELKNDLLAYIKRRLAPQPVKIRADIEVTCFTYEGIDAIKTALSKLKTCVSVCYLVFDMTVLLSREHMCIERECASMHFNLSPPLFSNPLRFFFCVAEGEEKSGADCQVKIKLIAPPMYVMTCMTLDKELGLETMNHCIEVIATTIRAKG